MAYPRKITASKQELEDMYINQVMTIKDIAAKFNVGFQSVSQRMKRDGIPLRRRCDVPTKELLYDWYVNKKMSIGKIAKQFGYRTSTVQHWLFRAGIILRSHMESANRMEDHPLWKGGRIGSKAGYLQIRLPNGKYQYEHRYVMEQHIGRLLKHTEIVHHINSDRTDNRIENLLLMGSKDHFPGNHQKGKTYLSLKTESGNLRYENVSLRAKIKMLEDEIKILKENL